MIGTGHWSSESWAYWHRHILFSGENHLLSPKGLKCERNPGGKMTLAHVSWISRTMDTNVSHDTQKASTQWIPILHLLPRWELESVGNLSLVLKSQSHSIEMQFHTCHGSMIYSKNNAHSHTRFIAENIYSLCGKRRTYQVTAFWPKMSIRICQSSDRSNNFQQIVSGLTEWKRYIESNWYGHSYQTWGTLQQSICIKPKI